MKLSIVIPTLNEEKFLPKLLESISKQDYKDYEIIVSDGSSEDNTIKIAKESGCETVVSKKRHPSYQRNAGAEKAKGEIILFLDADTRLPKMFLKNIIFEFENKNLSIGGFYIKIQEKKIKYKILTNFLNCIFKLSENILPTNIGIAIIVQKKAHKKIKGFDETIYIGEDYDYNKKISNLGKYKMLKSSFVIYSPRRLKKEGYFIVILKWLKASFYFIFLGSIRKKIVKYDFGKY